MKPNDLSYDRLIPALSVFIEKGRGESIGFINWFLENIYRLESVDADDCICDRPNDRGIDGLYVDHNQEEIHVLQGKLRQKESTIGDAMLRDLAGALGQVSTPDSVQSLLDGGGNQELKAILLRDNIKGLIEKGYRAIGVYISNSSLDANGKEFADQHGSIRVYDRNRIASEFINIETDGGVKGYFSFDTSYVEPMKLMTGDKVKTFIVAVLALELIEMEGIDDGTLFSQNVRQSLGNTKVNKALRESVLDADEHKNFPLYHNGVTILCSEAKVDGDKLTIKDYVVVNGAQSISTFKKTASRLSPDLRVIAKIVELNDNPLARKITVNSNNQNAIKPRDLKSNNEIQLRLREEFKRVSNGIYEFEIKRGQDIAGGASVITNEEAGRLLLAFDLQEPESCHQVYKLFDEKYSEIFARPEVSAWRIALLDQMMSRVQIAASGISYRPLSRYGLTQFFLLSVLRALFDKDEAARDFIKNPKRIFEKDLLVSFLNAVERTMVSLIVDLNYEVADMGDTFDYKGDLKSPTKIRELRNKLLKSYEKDVARGKVESVGKMLITP